MRLKDLLSRAASFTRTNIFGEAANDDGVSVTREMLSYVASGQTDRQNRLVSLATNWTRIETLVEDALSASTDSADEQAYTGLAALHQAIKNITEDTKNSSAFVNTVELDQDDIDSLITNLPYMAMVANHYNRVIKDGTTFLGVDLDEANDQIIIDNIENGPAQYARRHLEEVQMFAFRVRSHLTQFSTPQAKPDEQALGL